MTAAIVGLAICVPCLIPLLLAAGLSAGAFSAVGAAIGQPWVIALAALSVVFFTGAGVVVALRRRTRTACEPLAERSAIEGM